MNIKPLRIIISVATVFLAVFFLSGCLGVLHQIRLSDDGRYAVDVKLSMSQQMLAAMDELGGDPADTDDVFGRDDLAVDPETIPGLTRVTFEEISDDVDVGIRFSGVLGRVPDGIGPEDAPFIPFDTDDGLIIGLPSLSEGENSGSDPQMDQMAAMFFASTKYQLILDRNLYYDVSAVEVRVGDTVHPAALTELPGSWLIEFPFSTWMAAPDGCLVVVSF